MICVAFENAIDGMRMRAMPLRAAKDDIKSMGVVGVKWIVDASIDDFLKLIEMSKLHSISYNSFKTL